ncbi:MAG: PhoH family protein [Magnetococcales bacterium]|nr:PhoH family protein [Magnetococcales bacterium]
MRPVFTTSDEVASGETATATLAFPDNRLVAHLCGALDQHLRLVEERMGVALHPNGNSITLTASPDRVEKAHRLLEMLYAALEQGQTVDLQRVEAGLLALEKDEAAEELLLGKWALRTPLREIHPRTPRQAEYLRQIASTGLVFALGPAGTGKTYLAVAAAVAALSEGRVARIILTRPAVEAGERLGFLPGDLQDKVDPYLRPLYDALYDMLGYEKVERMLGRNLLEIAPLAYMRGRTLSEAFIILDEAQNATVEQMKMFLTRFGEGSRVVACGDVTQVDLPSHQQSGLAHAVEILHGVEGIAVARFTHRDVVRHPLVGRIVRAYEEAAVRRSTRGGHGR